MDDKDIVPMVRKYDPSVFDLKVADYIERLEEVVRAADRTADSLERVFGVTISVEKYRAARSRVNLPEIPDRSQSGYFPVQEKAGKQENFLSSQAALDNSVSDGFGDSFVPCGKDCSGHFARPGEFQCNGDGENCPNREASNGKEA